MRVGMTISWVIFLSRKNILNDVSPKRLAIFDGFRTGKAEHEARRKKRHLWVEKRLKDLHEQESKSQSNSEEKRFLLGERPKLGAFLANDLACC